MTDEPDGGIGVHLPSVERPRGPYEITVVEPFPHATVELRLTPETNRARAIDTASAYIARSRPGTHVTVHRWQHGTQGKTEYHALVDDDGMIRPMI